MTGPMMNEVHRSLRPSWANWLSGWILATLGILAMDAQAQVHPIRPKPSDTVVWSQQSWSYIPFDPARNLVLQTSPGNRTSIQRPAGVPLGNSWCIRDGALFFVGATPGDKDVHLYRSEMDVLPRTWTILGSFTSIRNGWPPALAIPLEDGKRFLCFSHPGSGFVLDGSASSAAIFRLSGRELVIDDLIDMPFDGKATIWRFEPGNGTSSLTDDQPPQAAVLGTCQPVSPILEPSLLLTPMTQEYAFLVATHAGVIWAFSLKDGHCVKTINLGGFDWSDLSSASLIENFILGAQPDRDGNLVVATRSQEIGALAKALFVDPATNPEAAKRARADFGQAVQRMGDVQWQVIDPKSLDAKSAAGGAYPEIKGLSYAGLNHFAFLIDADNQILTSLGGHWHEFLDRLDSVSTSGPKPVKAAEGSPIRKAPPRRSSRNPPGK